MFSNLFTWNSNSNIRTFDFLALHLELLSFELVFVIFRRSRVILSAIALFVSIVRLESSKHGFIFSYDKCFFLCNTNCAKITINRALRNLRISSNDVAPVTITSCVNKLIVVDLYLRWSVKSLT